MTGKVYARLALTESELGLVKGAISAIQRSLITKQGQAESGPERAFYDDRMAACDGVLAKIDAIYLADHSQDAEPDDDEDETEEDDQ